MPCPKWALISLVHNVAMLLALKKVIDMLEAAGDRVLSLNTVIKYVYMYYIMVTIHCVRKRRGYSRETNRKANLDCWGWDGNRSCLGEGLEKEHTK